MSRLRSIAPIAVAVLVCLVVARLDAAKTDIKADADPAFSFAGLKTWAWHPEGAGDVRLALTPDADPKRVAARADPVIQPAIEREMQARGFTKAAGQPDLYVHYYLLATVNQSAQVMGQFVAPMPMWGLPPFAPATTALDIYALGTLIIDISSPELKAIVWRGSASRKIDVENPDSERKKVVEKAVADLLKLFPPKPKKK
jgi:Domain of unknown function (DUF4136)